jgi:lysophospholipase L1-like esterase
VRVSKRRQLTPGGIGGTVLAALVAISVAVIVIGVPKLANPAVPHAGQAVGYVQPPAPIYSLWIGDSYTAGTGAASPESGEACLTAQAMGWRCTLDAEGGTGFVNPGAGAGSKPVPARLAQDRRDSPNVVVVDVGRNDGLEPWGRVRPVVTKYLTDLRAAFPRAHLVLIAPYYMADSSRFAGGRFAALYRRLAPTLHAVVIDPEVAGWMGTAQTAGLTIGDHVHPSPAGHKLIAQHLAADLKRAGLPSCSGC